MEVTVEWEQVQRRRAYLEVPDGTIHDEITAQADKLAHNEEDAEILATVVLDVSWATPDGQFGGRVR